MYVRNVKVTTRRIGIECVSSKSIAKKQNQVTKWERERERERERISSKFAKKEEKNEVKKKHSKRKVQNSTGEIRRNANTLVTTMTAHKLITI
jgi:hypothetical protein